MGQKLTVLVLLSTVLNLGAGVTVEARGLNNLTGSKRLAPFPSIPVEPITETGLTEADLTGTGLTGTGLTGTGLTGTDLTETDLTETALPFPHRSEVASTVNSFPPSPGEMADQAGGVSFPATTSPADQADGVSFPATTLPEKIGGLNSRQSGIVLGQVPATPPPADSLPEPLPDPEPEPTPEPVLPTTPVTPPGSTAPTPEPGPTVMVQSFNVSGSSVFDASDFDPVLAPFVGQSLGIDQLRQAADSITQLYLNQGYITSRAVLPNQPITDGVVQLEVIEGSLEEIRIEDTDRLANYVRSRIELGAKPPLNQFDLEDQLRLLRADPLIDNIEASLRAGTGLGQSILVVRIAEADPVEAHLSLDTDSPISVGVVRMGANVTYRNPFGIGDQIRAAAYRATTGGSNLYELSYSAPINAMNGTISARFLPSEFDIISPRDLADLNIEGDAQVYELTYRQPLVRNPREEFAISLGFRHRDGETRLLGRDFASNSASVIQFSQDYLRRDVQGAWALRSQFNLGVDWLDATNATSPSPDSQFVSWLGQVQRAQILHPDHLLIFQGDVQFSTDTLLGSEQFVIGGRQSVRGYSQNARFGDNGVRLSVEDRITIQRDESGVPIMLLSPFLDMATVWNTRSGTTANDDRFLLGTGVGFTYRPVEGLDLRLDVGVPLVDINDSAPQDVFIYLDFDLEL